MATIILRLFGAPRLERGGQILDFNRRKALGLAAFLALSDHPRSRETLSALLWPEMPESNARANLRRELSLLRTELGDDAIRADRSRLAFQVGGDVDVDVLMFERHIDAARGALALGDEGSGAAELEAAVATQSGEFLAGFHLPDSTEFDDWRFLHAERLRQSLAWALEQLVEWHIRHGRYDEALDFARQWVGLDPLNEHAQRRLIRLYALAGQWARAQRHLEQLIQLLDDELGVEPAPETGALREMLQARALDEQPVPRHERLDTAPRKETDARPHNLPADVTPFVGRQHEIEQLGMLLSHPDVRLVTILGPGGMGKTRLALAFARKMLEPDAGLDVRDGVAVVSLAARSSHEQVMFAIAESLGFRFDGSDEGSRAYEDQLQGYLRDRRMLIVLDTAEHIVDSVGLIDDILRGASGIKILATSRERLQLVEEHVLVIEGLPFPELENADARPAVEDASNYAAFQLFRLAARRASSGFDITPGNLSGVARICRIVGGLPLAIELAASRVNVLSLTDIADEIERNLDILESSARNIPRRQRSIRAVLDATWQGLNPEDQQIFTALAVFQDGWDRRAGREVAGATIASLGVFVDRSLILFDHGRNRYRMHEILRQFAGEKLTEDPDRLELVRDLHAAYFLGWLTDRAHQLIGPEQRSTLDEIRPELDNLRLAWEWVGERGVGDLPADTIDGLGRVLELEGRYAEGRATFDVACRAFDALLSRGVDGQQTPVARALARALIWRAVFERLGGDARSARQSLDRAFELIEREGLTAERGYALLQRGAGKFTAAEGETGAEYAEALEIFRAFGDRWNQARALAALGRIAWSRGDFDAANQYYEDSLALLREVGDEREAVDLLVLMSSAARYQGDFRRARDLADEIIRQAHASGDQVALAHGLGSLGGTLYFLGELSQGYQTLLEAHRLFLEAGADLEQAAIGIRLGLVASGIGDFDLARNWFERSQAVYAAGGLDATAAYIDANLAALDCVTGSTDVAALRLAEAIQILRGTERPTALGVVLAMSALVSIRRDERGAAAALARDSLEQALRSNSYLALVHALSAAARTLPEFPGAGRALGLWELLARQPMIRANALYKDLLGPDLIAELSEGSDVVAGERRSGATPLLDTARQALELLAQQVH